MSADRRSSRPRAELLTIAELLDQVELGKIRVPNVQRAWKWEGRDVRDLFDSLWRGIPIGTLIMWRRAADAEVLTLGPVKINCKKRTDAWFVVDGHQRLTALVGVLLSSQNDPQFQEFSLYFDLKNESWHQSSGSSHIDPAWFPVRELYSVSQMFHWARSNSLPEELWSKVSELREAIMETRVPTYVVESEDPYSLQEVFDRINHSGKKLSPSDSTNLLFGTDGLYAPSRLSDLRDEIAQLGFGDVEEAEIGRCALFANGRQFTRSAHSYLAHLASTERTQLLKDAREPLRQAVIFLQSQAGIQHKLLLPHALPLYVLTRFFAVHPNPSPRCLVLLTRWVWRRVTNGYFGSDHKPTIRAAMNTINTSRSDEQIAESLLGQITQSEPWTLSVNERFEENRPTTRILALALLSAKPRSLVSGMPIEVSPLLSKHGARAFRYILPIPPTGLTRELFHSIANRVFHPPIDEGDVLALLRSRSASPEQLASHDLPASLLDNPSDAAIVAALQARAVTLQRRVHDLVDLRCAWERPNRVSVSAILDEEDTEPEARTP